MTLHIFNPEHDLALASNLRNFTSPHAGRQLRHDLSWLPALWASEGDKVLVDDCESAMNGYRILLREVNRLKAKSVLTKDSERSYQTLIANDSIFVAKPHDLEETTSISPWGWNQALRFQLKNAGAPLSVLPTEETIDTIRNLSHRKTSRTLLSSIHESIKDESIIGKSTECHSIDEITSLLKEHKSIVIKAPWSSSGRGVRFIDNEINASTAGWLRNTLQRQGSVMVEAHYSKIKDFAMEFHANDDKTISYCGLSLFDTTNGAYTGNLLATESRKEEIMSRFILPSTFVDIRKVICEKMETIIDGHYIGPFGVDMMIIGNPDADKEKKHYYINPCVEINLRRTMGHVALALTKAINPLNDNDFTRIMRITFEDNQYKLKIQR